MLDVFDKRLRDWVTNIVPEIEVCLTLPNQQKTGRGVGLYLMEIVQLPSPSTVKLAPLQFALRYLVTAWSGEPEDAHRIIGNLLFAAIGISEGNESDHGPGKTPGAEKDLWPGTEVERDPVPITLWTAFGIPPCPSFVLRVPLRQERPQAPAKPVRLPLTLKSSPVISFHGLLLGPGNIPLSDSRVEMPALRLSTRTDYKGRFHFPCVPAQGVKLLCIKAKGREFSVSSNDNYPDSRDPLVVCFDPLEG